MSECRPSNQYKFFTFVNRAQTTNPTNAGTLLFFHMVRSYVPPVHVHVRSYVYTKARRTISGKCKIVIGANDDVDVKIFCSPKFFLPRSSNETHYTCLVLLMFHFEHFNSCSTHFLFITSCAIFSSNTHLYFVVVVCDDDNDDTYELVDKP